MSISLSVISMFLLLGFAAAAPIGPVNVEIIRRHLHLGASPAIVFGMGACLADVTYLILLLTGLLVFIKSQTFLYLLGIVGSLVIGMFGYITLRAKGNFVDKSVSKTGYFRQLISGYLMTILNPYTVLFWVSVSAQVAVFQQQSKYAAVLGGFGVLLGTLLWVLILNFLIHCSRKFITPFRMRIINYISGFVLIVIAIMGEYHALSGYFC